MYVKLNKYIYIYNINIITRLLCTFGMYVCMYHVHKGILFAFFFNPFDKHRYLFSNVIGVD